MRLSRFCMMAVLLPIAAAAAAQGGAFPPRLESYLASVVRLSAAERQQLLDGAPVSKLIEAGVAHEIAVFGAIWVAAPMSRYVEAVNQIESFETGRAFRNTTRISDPPVLEDFARLRLPAEDVADLRDCRVGDCAVKLGEEALRRFRTEVNWNGAGRQAEADALMRRLLLDYVTRYLAHGNQSLAVYRDSSRPTVVAEEFRGMVMRMPELAASLPNLRDYLLEYPRVAMAGATSFLYWQETSFGLKPTLRLNHLVIREGPEDTVVASKMLYASHYFWTALQLRVLVPDATRGTGFWLVTAARSRSDGLSGLTGMFLRRRVRAEGLQASLTSLRATKRRLERQP